MADDDDVPCCRICFDSTDDPRNPLFRPCHCRGTSAWVHMECLDTWRRTSVNPKSYYECDACKFKYKLGTTYLGDQFFLARMLATSGAVHALTLLALAAVIFVGGFVGKAFDPTMTWWDVVLCFNLRHLVTGATTTGLCSLVGWLGSLGGFGGFGGGGWRIFGFGGFDHHHHGGRGGNSNDVVGAILFGIAVLAGLCVAFSWIYARLEQWARQTTRFAQHVVLDVQGGRAPRARQPQEQPDAAAQVPPAADDRGAYFEPID